METRASGVGKLEIGIVTHDGHVFAAFGSSVNRTQRNGLHPAP